MANRIRRCATRKEFEQIVDDFVTTGYVVKSRGEDNALLVKKGQHTKHGLVALLTFWWTLGLGNLIYALIPVKNEDEVLVKIDG
ncbi:MAG: hypothetical protein K2L42_00590 [Clostridia bacterium]|nr:hypothetical protein [Clostridia bacterium]